MQKKIKPNKNSSNAKRIRKKSSRETLSISTTEQLKAIADPIRQQILEKLAIKPATTKQVALMLGYQPTRLYHHVAKLERAGLIKLVSTRPVRGTIEKYYSAVATRIEIDSTAFNSKATKTLNEFVGLGIIDSLLTNVHNEVSEYLEEHNDNQETEKLDRELMFAQVEVEADQVTIHKIREKIDSLIEEIEESCNKKTQNNTRKYRLVIGCYPRATVKTNG